METQKRIIAISGSTRQSSSNLSLIRHIAQLYLGELDIKIFEELSGIPHFNPDLDNEVPPENVLNFRRQLKQADGILICTPEYAMGVPGTLKNAIDWASRPESDDEPPLVAFRGKIAALVSASPGGLGGLRALVHVRAILENIGVLVLPDQVAVSAAYEAFDEGGKLKDARKAKQVADLAANLAETIRKLKS